MVQVAAAIFGDLGRAIAAQAKQDIIQMFGMDIWMQIEQFKEMDLDVFYHV